MFKQKHVRGFVMVLATLAFTLFVTDVAAFGSKDEKEKTTSKSGTAPRKGVASWYGPNFQGKKTSTGELYDMAKLTCASNKYPLGTWLKVTNESNGKSVVVRVNDRMHPRMTRIVDLSKAAATKLGYIKAGITRVLVENLGTLEPDFRL